ncbi:MAG: uncharacterized protein QOJ73_4102 [Streptosporangiaceae bacterium]|nr:uncharacterized protein [Streptosporangiaceae bacterium]
MEATYDKFLPQGVPAWQMPFWESLRAHSAEVQRCDSCGAFRYVPKEICPHCHSRAATWTPIDGRGQIYTYTIVRRAPTPAYQAEAPYAIVHVTMQEDFRMIGTTIGISLDDVRIGLPVRADYDDVTPEWTLLRFTAND